MFIITLIVFILIIGILVLVHEFGHYITARMVGIRVEEFAIGMGPKIWGWKKQPKGAENEIEYNLRALPIGGFVKMYGEDDYDNKSSNSFAGKKPSRRLIVLLAGVTMNFILAVFLMYMQGFHQDFKYRNIEGIFEGEYKPWFGDKTAPKVAIRQVDDDSPLKGQVKDFDIITKLNGEEYELQNFFTVIQESKGKEITLELTEYASASTREIKVTPRSEYPKEEGPLGIQVGFISFTEFNGTGGKIFSGIGQGLNTVQNFGFSIGELVKKAFKENTAVPVADNVGGAISIFEVLSKIITAFGFWGVLELAALFSINLAVFNVLPIPALDGGHVLFTLLEIITRRKLPAKIFNILTFGGFALLMGLMVVVTGLDLIKHTKARDLFCNDKRQVRFICSLSDYR